MCRPAPLAAPAGATGTTPEIADIVRARRAHYRRTHALAGVQLKALRAIEQCRTAALGGRCLSCDTCRAHTIIYNSCRNRHCPKCQSLDKERWLQERRA